MNKPRGPKDPPDFAKMDRNHLVLKREVCQYLGVSQSKLDQIRRTDPTFPKPVKIGPRSQRWVFGELSDWAAARPKPKRPV